MINNMFMKVGRLYKVRHGNALYFNGAPYRKIEIKKFTDKTVTYLTEVPIWEITVSHKDFDKYFERW